MATVGRQPPAPALLPQGWPWPTSLGSGTSQGEQREPGGHGASLCLRPEAAPGCRLEGPSRQPPASQRSGPLPIRGPHSLLDLGGSLASWRPARRPLSGMEVSASGGQWWETCCIRAGVGVGACIPDKAPGGWSRPFPAEIPPWQARRDHTPWSLHSPRPAPPPPTPTGCAGRVCTPIQCQGREPCPVQPACKGCPLVAVQGTHPASPHQTRSSSLPTPPTALPGDPSLFQNVPCHPHPHAGPGALHL